MHGRVDGGTLTSMARTPATPIAFGVAAVSMPGIVDVATGLPALLATIGRARRRGARLIVLPEATLGGYLREDIVEGTVQREAPPVLASADRQEAFSRISAAAGDAIVCVGYGEPSEHDGELPHAAAVCLSGDGVLGHQRKVHIPPGEIGAFAPGSSFAAFDTPIGRLGMLVCYDKLFPEAARRLALDGAETIACLSAWAVCRQQPARLVRNDRQVRHFNAIDIARAVENQVVWVSANQTGCSGRLRFPGQSKVVDPDGRVLAATGSRSGIALAAIDPRLAVGLARQEISHLGDRVQDAYDAPAAPLDLPLAA